MKKCIICRESYDGQFISRYEITDNHKKDMISVCEFCFEEKAIYDEEKNTCFIEFGNGEYYPSDQI